MTECATTRRRRLDATFVELADTLITGFDLAQFLDRLLVACSDALDCAGAGLLFTEDPGRPEVMGASSEPVRQLELLELEQGTGPGLDCLLAGSPLGPVILAGADPRWAAFSGAAQTHGYVAVQAMPMRLRETTIGAVSFLHTAPPTSTAADVATAQALVDVATIGILQQRLIRHGIRLAEQLQAALTSRLVIEQAKGLLAERGGMGIDAAFDALRAFCRSNRLSLSDTARALVFGEIGADRVLARRSAP